jgi:hypothetical protein
MESSNFGYATFHVLRYVPDIVRDEPLNIGIVLYEDKEDPRFAVKITRNWKHVLRLYPDAPTKEFEKMEAAILKEVQTALDSTGAPPRGRLSPGPLEISFQIVASVARGTLLPKSFDKSVEWLMQMYVEPR